MNIPNYKNRQKINSWSAKTRVIALLTLLPILNIITIIVTTGANNPSNDYIQSISFIDRVLSGTYDWENYFQNAFFNGHSVVFPMLVRLGVAYFANFNVYVEFYIAVALTILKLFLIYDALTYRFKSSLNWLLLPGLAALVFSTSQISVFTFGYAALEIGLNTFGFALGVWGLVRFSEHRRGIYIMAAGGILASWSFGFGMMTWPVLAIGLVQLRFRKISHYLIWLSAGFIASLPYLFYLKLQSDNTTSILSLFNVPLIIRGIGWPLAQNFSQASAQWSGWTGMGLFVIGLGLLWRKHSKKLIAQASPALMYISYALLSIWQITIFRGQHAPWYATPFMFFWIGLFGLAYIIWLNHRVWLEDGMPSLRAILLSARSWSLAVVFILTLLYAISNITYTDKIFHLYSRTPASSACLREYRTAPTYCEERLFQWGVGHSGIVQALAQPLERHHLSVFAPRQRWTLQGDFGLNKVKLNETPDVPDIFWSADKTAIPTPWHHYKHLNLFLHSPNSVSWKVSLPANLKQANFHSAVAISSSVPSDASADGVTFEVYIDRDSQPSTLAYSKSLAAKQHRWHGFTIPLSDYAGETITLRLTSNPGGNVTHDEGMYRYPFINLQVESTTPNLNQEEIVIRPSNTELSPQFPKTTVNDFRFNVTNSNLWTTSGDRSGSNPSTMADTWKVTQDPLLQYEQSLDPVCMADYSHFYVRLAASTALQPRALKMYYRLDDIEEFNEGRSFTIPLLADDKIHEYTYSLKLLELGKYARLTGVQLRPILTESILNLSAIPDEQNWVRVTDFRLIRKDSGTCNTSEHSTDSETA